MLDLKGLLVSVWKTEVVERDQEQATWWWSWRFYQNFLGLLVVVQFGELVGNMLIEKGECGYGGHLGSCESERGWWIDFWCHW